MQPPATVSDSASPPGIVAAQQATVGGRYALRGLIGTGSSSSVYAAHDLVLGRDVAVKLFAASADDPEHLRAAEREARLVAGLEHPALTTIFDAGIDVQDPLPPRVYLVMERMRGGDLRARLEAGALTARQVVWLGGDLTSGLQHMHQRGLLHRDLKPANVLLTDHGTDAQLAGKLADFGVARHIGAPRIGSTMGTLAYISPEQAGGFAASTASDVYALGLVLLEALTGVLEFPGDARTSTQSRLDRDARIPDRVPHALAGVLLSMLHRAPEDRATLPTLMGRFASFRPGEDEHVDDGATGRLAAPERSHGEVPTAVLARIAHLATRLLAAPVAIVSLDEAGSTVIRSCVGLGDAASRIGQGDALCSAARDEAAPWTVSDVRDDPALATSAILAAHPDLAGFATAPLVAHDGRTIGSLTVLDRGVRHFTDAHLADLEELADVLVSDLQLRRSIRRALFRVDADAEQPTERRRGTFEPLVLDVAAT